MTHLPPPDTTEKSGAPAPPAASTQPTAPEPATTPQQSATSGKLTRSDWIAIAALVVSLASGVWTQLDNRRFAKYDLAPRLNLHFVEHNDDAFYGIVLQNAGRGPARIEQVLLLISEKDGILANEEGWLAILDSLKVPNIPEVRTTSFSSQAEIAADERLRVVGALRSDLTPELQRKIDVFRKLPLGICYCSITGDCFSLATPGIETNICEVEPKALK
jgi:hypothetical protein